jgi:hypothetical protein
MELMKVQMTMRYHADIARTKPQVTNVSAFFWLYYGAAALSTTNEQYFSIDLFKAFDALHAD